MRLLIRHFLRSFFTAEQLVPGDDPRILLAATAALFGMPGFFVFLPLFIFPNPNPAPEIAAFLAITMALTGLMAAVVWEALFPTRLDYLVLGALPLPWTAIARAKLAALAALMVGFPLAVNSVAIVLVPMIAVPNGAGFVALARAMAASAAATLAGAAWLFCCILAVRGLLLVTGGDHGRAILGRSFRLGLIVVLLSALLLSPEISRNGVLAHLARTHPWWAMPVLWFMGLDHWLAGSASAAAARMAAAGLHALGWALLAAVAMFALACWRGQRQALAQASVRRRWSPLRALRLGAERRWLPRPDQRAVFRFTAALLERDPQHGLYLSLWLAAGVAVVALWTAELVWRPSYDLASVAQADATALAAPLVLCFFLLLGLRHAFTIPLELPSNWIFELSETGGHTRRLGAAYRVMAWYAIIPVLAAMIPFSIYMWGWRIAVIHLTFSAVLACLLAEVLLLRFRRIPFTCPYVPGRANVKLWLAAYWLLFLGFSYVSSMFERWLWFHAVALACALAIGAAAVVALAADHRRWLRSLAGCQFEDQREAEVQTLFAG